MTDSLPDRRALADRLEAVADDSPSSLRGLESAWQEWCRDAASLLRADAGRREAVEQLIEAGEAMALSYNNDRHPTVTAWHDAVETAVRAAGGESEQ